MAASYFGGEVKETRRLQARQAARHPHPQPPADVGHAAQRQGSGLPAFHGAPGRRPFRGAVPRGHPQGRRVRHDAAADQGGAATASTARRSSPSAAPTRRATSSPPAEADLYQAVTDYVREEMNRADRSGDGKRRNNVGFALQILQRRLASSPAAIYRSLERRRKRLEERLREERGCARAGAAPLSARRRCRADDARRSRGGPRRRGARQLEEQIVDQATAAHDARRACRPRSTSCRTSKQRRSRAQALGPGCQVAASSNRILDDPTDARRRDGHAAEAHHLHRAEGHARVPAAEDRAPASASPRRWW